MPPDRGQRPTHSCCSSGCWLRKKRQVPCSLGLRGISTTSPAPRLAGTSSRRATDLFVQQCQ